MKNDKKILKDLILLGQFAISMVAPLFICVYISFLIDRKFVLGGKAMIAGIIVGGMAMVNSYYRFYKQCKGKDKKGEKSEFNNHV
ncbi:MAG: AtpZ/AtpI family protein [Lachnospiraceae bacterium]